MSASSYPANYASWPKEKQDAAYADRLRRAKPELPENDQSPQFSDDALALRFSQRYAGQLRYVAAWNKWLWWDDRRWVFEDTKLAFDYARVVCREAAGERNNHKSAAAVASAKTVAAVERLASADRCIAATIDQWDTDHGC